MIKKSLKLLTLTAVTVQGKGFNFWEEPRSLKAIECSKDAECKSVSSTAICMNQKVSTKTEKICVA